MSSNRSWHAAIQIHETEIVAEIYAPDSRRGVHPPAFTVTVTVKGKVQEKDIIAFNDKVNEILSELT